MPSSTPYNEETGTGCIIENAEFHSLKIEVYNASPKICNNIQTSGILQIAIGSGSQLSLTIR
jgi:hypothetical protein